MAAILWTVTWLSAQMNLIRFISEKKNDGRKLQFGHIYMKVGCIENMEISRKLRLFWPVNIEFGRGQRSDIMSHFSHTEANAQGELQSSIITV